MKIISRKSLLALFFTFLAMGSLAQAIKPAPAINEKNSAFRAWVVEYAKQHQMQVADWWSAKLDPKAKPAMIALLCPQTKVEPMEGIYLVEGVFDYIRWEVRFLLNKQTGVNCDREAGKLPEFLQKTQTVIRHRQDDADGSYDIIDLAMRNGEVVVVGIKAKNAEEDKPYIINYDHPPKNEHRYPTVFDGNINIPIISTLGIKSITTIYSTAEAN